MTLNKTHIAVAIAGIFMLLFTSCHSSKKSATATPSQPEIEQPTETPAQVVKDLTSSYGAWTDISVSAKFKVTKPKNLSVSGTLKMVRGKSVYASARMLGFEVGSLYADQDSIYIITKVSSAYFAESMSKFSGRYDITIEDIQSILLGRLFLPGQGTVSSKSASDFNITPLSDSEFAVSPKKMAAGLEWIFGIYLNDNNPQLAALALNGEKLPAVGCTFGTPYTTPYGPVSTSINATSKLNKSNIDITITLSPEKANWNSGLQISRPSLPKNGKRLTSDQIFKLLNKL